MLQASRRVKFSGTAAATVAAALLSMPAVAQRSNAENSPYSRYALGDPRGGTHVGLRAMGSASTAYAAPFSINPDNPASYSMLRFTTYEGAGEGSRKTLSLGSNDFSSGTAALSYVRVGIPLGKYGGMAFGVQPETRVYYRVASDTLLERGLGRTASEYTGEGGTNYAYIGLAGKLKGFSAGANFGYLFGNIERTAIKSFLDPDTAQTLNSRYRSITRIGGVYAKLGAQYEAKVAEKYTLRIGATANLRQDITARREETTESIRRYVGLGSFRDTLVRVEPLRDVIVIPLSYSGGIGLSREDKWGVYLDYRATRWSDYRFFGATDSLTDNAWRVGIGGEFTPRPTARDLASRITYRAGFSYGQDYLRLRGGDFSVLAATAGVSLPFRRSADRIHAGLEVGRRRPEVEALTREGYVRFTLGLSLIDRWFVKRRYE